MGPSKPERDEDHIAIRLSDGLRFAAPPRHGTRAVAASLAARVETRQPDRRVSEMKPGTGQERIMFYGDELSPEDEAERGLRDAPLVFGDEPETEQPDGTIISYAVKLG